MDTSILLKYLAALILFAAWFAIVWFQMPSAESLVAFIQIALGGLAGHGATAYGLPKQP